MTMGKRPGLFIKDYLETHGRASIPEMHRAFKLHISGLSALSHQQRGKSKPFRKPTYHSFYQYFRSLLALGLVEFAGEEFTDLTGAGEGRKPGKPEALAFAEQLDSRWFVTIGARRRYWRLTAAGRAEIRAWEDPLGARGYSPR